MSAMLPVRTDVISSISSECVCTLLCLCAPISHARAITHTMWVLYDLLECRSLNNPYGAWSTRFVSWHGDSEITTGSIGPLNMSWKPHLMHPTPPAITSLLQMQPPPPAMKLTSELKQSSSMPWYIEMTRLHKFPLGSLAVFWPCGT